MFPLISGLISGGASLLGSIFSSDTSAQNTQAQIAGQEQMQQQSETFNAGQAQMNRDFQQQMSSTAYQRASQDMQKAGLNPAMMFGSGGAASSPSGSTASVGTPTMPTPQRTSPMAGLGDAVQKAFSSAMQVKTFDKMTDEIANLQTERAKIEAQTALTKQATATEGEETLKKGNENSLLALRMPGARFSAKSAEDLESMPDWLRKTLTIGGYAGGKVGDAISPVTDLISSAKNVRSLLPSRSTQETTNSRTGDSTFTDRWHGLYD